jgi:hypothetical protein
MARKGMSLFRLVAGVSAVLAAGFLGPMGIETASVLAADTPGETQPAVALPEPVGPEGAPAARSAVEQLSMENQVLLQQITQLEALLHDREVAYQSQWQQVAAELTAARSELRRVEAEQTSSQQKVETLQQSLATGDAAFQTEIQDTVSQLATEEAQLRQQLELTYTELQAAYDQLGAYPPPVTYGDSGGNSNSSGGESHESVRQDENHHDNNDDDRHDDGEHENDDD